MPIGGASVTGAASYAWAADELPRKSTRTAHGSVDWIVVANGSGGTHAGLLAGLGAEQARVLGVDVGTRPDLDDVIPRLAAEAAARAGRARRRPSSIVDHTRFGDGYGARHRRRARGDPHDGRGLEGIILDPVYTGKAMAGLIGCGARGQVRRRRHGRVLAHGRRGGAVRQPLRRAVLRP